MGHLESVIPPTSSPHGLELAQIFGENDEQCSVRALLVNMPRDVKCHHSQVFYYPESTQNKIQQKIKSVLLSLPESSYVETFNTVQLWAPTSSSSSSGSTDIILSVSKQAFGIDRICNGVCKNRFFSVLSRGQVDASDPVGRAFLFHSPEFVVNVDGDYSHQRSFAWCCGFRSSWVIPLVNAGGMLSPPVCVGVLQFLTRGDVRFDSTLVDKFQKLMGHVVGVLNSPSDTGKYSSPRLESVDAPPSEQSFADEFGFADFSLPDLSFSFSDDENAANIMYGQHQLGADQASSYNINFSSTDTGDEQLLQARPAEEDTRFNVASYETSESTVSKKTRSVGIPKISKAVIEQHFGRNIADASEGLGVSRSTLKRYCRSYGYPRWPSYKRQKLSRRQYSMTVKARYGIVIMRFPVLSDVDIHVLRVELGRRFELEVGTFVIQYRDDTGDLITIPCNEDLWHHINTLNSANQETMYLLLSPRPSSLIAS